MAYYIFNVIGSNVPQATRRLHTGLWTVRPEEPHRDALAPGDQVLIYLAAPLRVFIGRAKLASAVHRSPAAEGQVSSGGPTWAVALDEVEAWDPPVPMQTVLARIDRSAGARADFETGVVQITPKEYAAARAVAAARGEFPE